MRCPSCAHINRPDQRFCTECGRRLDASCPRCGAATGAAAKFCGACGTALAAGEGLAAVPRAPAAYTPRHLAERILTSRSALRGERKQVTVLFADVHGSMDLAGEVDAEEWHHILDRFFQILTEGVHRFEGTVNQYTGDGIMALFGAPLAHEDHARRAGYAALHLTAELRRYGEELKRTAGLNFSVRIGLNSGEVVVGAIGDDLRMDYTAQGHTVGLAARLEQLAEPGKAYLSEHTARLCEGFFSLRELGAFNLKGIREPVRVYELQDVGPLRTRLDLSRTRGLSRFVGRERETAQLEQALARAAAGAGQVVGLVAEPGIGKSRLCFEFAERCRARGLAVYAAGGVPHGKWIPFLPVFDLLRAFCGVSEDDGAEAARRKIAGTLLLRDDAFKDDLPLLFDLLGIGDAERPAPHLDAEARQRQFFAMIGRLLRARAPGARAGGAVAVLVLEDLHWFDAASDAALAHLVDAVPVTPTLLMVNFRPEYRAAWMETAGCQQIVLEPLGGAAVADLLRGLLGSDDSLAGLADRLRTLSGGNPFFIEEVVHTLIETGTLIGAQGAYRLARPPADLVIPPSVQAVLAARIDRLPERGKAVLQTAAVIGTRFAEPVLTRVVDLPPAELEDAVRALAAAGFFYLETPYPTPEYAFKHVLTQEVAYRSQLGETRARLHAAVAAALQIVYADRLDERAALVAQQWEGAGDAGEAARWNARAAVWAAVRDRADAQRHWWKVRALLDTAAPSAEVASLPLQARIEILLHGIRLGMTPADAASVFAEGKQLAEHAGDRRGLARLCIAYGIIQSLAGGAADGRVYQEEAVRLAQATDDAGLHLAAEASRIYSYLETDRLREALAAADLVLVRPPDDLRLGMDLVGFSPYTFVRMYRGVALMSVARLDEAAHDLDAAIEMAQQCGDTELLGLAHGFRALLGEYTGDTEHVLDHARQAVQIAEKVGTPLSRQQAYGMLGSAHALHGQWREAAGALDAALAIARETRAAPVVEPLNLARRAEASLGLGEPERARAMAAEAAAGAAQRGAVLFECYARLVYARILMQVDGRAAHAAAAAALARTQALADRVGATTYAAFVSAARAELARLCGDTATWRQQLREAERLFAAMGARAHATQAARQLDAA